MMERLLHRRGRLFRRERCTRFRGLGEPLDGTGLAAVDLEQAMMRGLCRGNHFGVSLIGHIDESDVVVLAVSTSCSWLVEPLEPP